MSESGDRIQKLCGEIAALIIKECPRDVGFMLVMSSKGMQPGMISIASTFDPETVPEGLRAVADDFSSAQVKYDRSIN